MDGIRERNSRITKKIKELKENKKNVSVELSVIMKKNNLDCIDVTSGQIRYTKHKVKKGINQAYLQEVMEKYHNKEEAKKICEFIQANRAIQETDKIQFKPLKNE